jgi:hypothetical protein
MAVRISNQLFNILEEKINECIQYNLTKHPEYFQDMIEFGSYLPINEEEMLYDMSNIIDEIVENRLNCGITFDLASKIIKKLDITARTVFALKNERGQSLTL